MDSKQIISALNWRYAVKAFDASKEVSEEHINTILEAGRLAPSSFGIEAWQFLVVKNKDIRAKIRAVGYDQPKITDSSHLIVITRRTDSENISEELMQRLADAQGKSIEDFADYKAMVDGSIEYHTKAGSVGSWMAAQTYIALGIMMETAALLEIDTCPMEGFDASAVNEILDLSSQNLSAVTMLSVGYRGEDPYAKAPKARRALSEVIKVIE